MEKSQPLATRSISLLFATRCSLLALLLAWPAAAADKALPDFSGYWGRNSTDFEPPASGPGPVTNKMRSFYSRIGDDTNPILKPDAAERVRQASKFGHDTPAPSFSVMKTSRSESG